MYIHSSEAMIFNYFRVNLCREWPQRETLQHSRVFEVTTNKSKRLLFLIQCTYHQASIDQYCRRSQSSGTSCNLQKASSTSRDCRPWSQPAGQGHCGATLATAISRTQHKRQILDNILYMFKTHY